MPTPAPAADGSAQRQTSFREKFEMAIDPSKSYTATISTSMGDMVAFLSASDAPETVNNFVNLARHHYYDGLIFHRVIAGFMIQGGCPEGSGRGGPGYRFEDELPAPGKYQIGSLCTDAGTSHAILVTHGKQALNHGTDLLCAHPAAINAVTIVPFEIEVHAGDCCHRT